VRRPSFAVCGVNAPSSRKRGPKEWLRRRDPAHVRVRPILSRQLPTPPVVALERAPAGHVLDDSATHLHPAARLSYAGLTGSTPAWSGAAGRAGRQGRTGAASARPLVARAITVRIAGNLSAHRDAQKPWATDPAGRTVCAAEAECLGTLRGQHRQKNSKTEGQSNARNPFHGVYSLG
jgi:hypothetical protein